MEEEIYGIKKRVIEMNSNSYPKKCAVCHGPRNTKGNEWRKKTCSSKCATIYGRLYDYLIKTIKNKYELIPKKELSRKKGKKNL